MSRRPQLVPLLALALGTPGAADDTGAFSARRRALMDRLDGGVALLAGAAETRAYAAFRQDNDFYYLTGVEVPGAFLLVDGAERKSTLFLPARDIRVEDWEGARLIPGAEARRRTGIEQVLDAAQVAAELERRVAAGRPIYLRHQPEETAGVSRDRAAAADLARAASPWDGRPSREQALDQALRRRFAHLPEARDLSPILDALRRVKDAAEIARLREAARIGVLGIEAAIATAAPGRTEYQLAAVAELVFRWEGAFGPSYFPVVASGRNSCLVHYHANARTLKAGDVVVLDFGPDYRYYQSDITRTFPASEAFTAEQRRVYEVVLEAQGAALARVRPGATFRDLDAAARAVIERAGYGKYWMHGVSHYVGMSVHDVGAPVPFEAGVVLTVEPGVYIPEKHLGVRIEDTVLVTAAGCENLTGAAARTVAAIEALRRAGRSREGFPLGLLPPGVTGR